MPADLPFPRSWSRAADQPGTGPGQRVVDAAHGYALWVFDAGLACCAVECAAALARLPDEPPSGGGSSAGAGRAPGAAGDGAGAAGDGAGAAGDGAGAAGDGAGAAGDGAGAAGDGAGSPGNVLLVAGTVTDKLAPLVRQAYQDLPEPKFVLSFGACSNSGGPYWDSYCVIKGVDQFIPVDVYVPGCPPRPEALLHGLDVLAAQQAGAGRRPAGAGPGRRS